MRRFVIGSALVAFSALAACEADHDPPRASRLAVANDDRSLTDIERLGKAIFEDTRLSEPPGQACASCHVARAGFSGNNGSRIPAVALGSRPETFGNRNVPTAMYAQFSPPFAFVAEVGDDGRPELTPTGGQFWDGRAPSLDEQAKGPFLNVREMNNPDRGTVVAKMRGGSYASLFRKVFGDGALDDDGAYDRAAQAIAAFERTPRFAPFSSKFDDFLRGEAELDRREARGFALFVDPEKGNCISCHVGELGSHEPSDWLFTDFTYDNLGVPRNRMLPDNSDDQSFDLGLCKQDGIAQRLPAGAALESLCGAFKVPTLRNVAVTAPYMHNGYFTDLHDVVRFYVTRDTNPERWYPGGQKFDDLPPPYWKNVNTSEVPYDRKPGEAPRLNEEEIDAIVSFLETLTDR